MTRPEPHIEFLPVAKLIVDPDVQRGLDKLRVDRIVRDYRIEALGVVVVSHRSDGTYHVMDGQHRIQATIAAGYGDRSINCLVYEDLCKADEAAMFRRLNNTRTVNALDKFRVRVVEGEPVATALTAILNKNGWVVAQSKNPGNFAAVAALESVYHGKLNGPGTTLDVCDTLIRVATEAWGHSADGVRAELVAGLGAVLLRFSNRVELPKLISELAQCEGGPRGLVGKAKGLRDFRRGTLSDATAEVIVALLNKQRRTNRLPEWRSAS